MTLMFMTNIQVDGCKFYKKVNKKIKNGKKQMHKEKQDARTKKQKQQEINKWRNKNKNKKI